MNTKFIVVGTLAAALTLYVWQVVSNVALPWHNATMTMWEGATNDAVVQAMRTHAPENGVYASGNGVFAAVSFAPDFSDKSQNMAPMMAKQIGIDIVVAFLLVLVLARTVATTPVRTGVAFALAGLAAGIVTDVSNWNWYGFDFAFVMVNVIDLAIAWFLAGLVLAIVQRRFGATAAEPAGVKAQGGLAAPSSGTSARAR